MKLFQQLLVAPAALGLLAPLAANAAEVNINDVASYATPSAQVTTSKISNVVPGDWSYTALQNLSESYGCVDNAYTQKIKSGQALTRYEAAALINACLDGGIAAADVGADAARLSNEFGTEITILKGRSKRLGNKVKEFSAGQFSDSTKVTAEAHFNIGSITYDQVPASETGEALHSRYSFKVNTNTSFNGTDALIAKLETGNSVDVGNNAGSRMATANSVIGDGTVKIDELFYTRPIGDFTLAAGPLFKQEAFVATTTSTYSNDAVFGAYQLGPNDISLNDYDLGDTPGLTLAYNNPNGFNAGFGLVSINGTDASSGMYTDEGADIMTATVGYDADNFGGGLIYTITDNPSAVVKRATGIDVTAKSFSDDPKVVGLGGYWQATDSFDISLGVDFIDLGIAGYEEATSWSVGADWEVGPGTLSAGFAHIPGWIVSGSDAGKVDDVGDSYELYYSYPINDGVSVKPMVYWTSHGSTGSTNWVDHTIFAVETTFKF